MGSYIYPYQKLEKKHKKITWCFEYNINMYFRGSNLPPKYPHRITHLGNYAFKAPYAVLYIVFMWSFHSVEILLMLLALNIVLKIEKIVQQVGWGIQNYT